MAERDAVSPMFREALRAWVQAALDVLRGRDVPGKYEIQVTLQEGASRSEGVQVPDYFWFVLRNSEALSDLAETETVLEVVRGDPELRAVLLADTSGAPFQVETEKSRLVTERLVPFTAVVLERAHHIDRTDRAAVDAIVVQVYDLFEEAVLRFESIPVRWLVQFANLGLEVDDFALEPGIRVRRPTEQEKIYATQASHGTILGLPSLPPPMSANPAMAMYIPDPGEFPDVFLEISDHRRLPRNQLSWEGAVRLAERALTALRLVNGNNVGIHSIWYSDDNPFDHFHMPRHMWPDPIPPDRFGPEYVVTPDIEHQLRELWPRLAAEPTEDAVALALRRLNDSYHRARSEDRLIDYWIALEALFLPKERTPDMGIAAALAISHYLGETVEDRRSMYEFVKASHSLRSYVVHPKSSSGDKQFDSKVTKTANLLQRSLRKKISEN